MFHEFFLKSAASIPEILLLIDRDFRILWANEEIRTQCQTEPQGRKCFEILHGREVPSKRCPAKMAIATKKPCQGVLHSPRLGSLYVSVSPVIGDQGEVESLWILGVRLSRPEAQEALSFYRYEIIGRLAAGFIHDIKNLLSYLTGELEILEMITSEERLKRRYQKMRVVLESLSTLTRRLSSLGNLHQKPEIINLNQVLKDLTPLIRAFLPPQAKCEITVDPDLRPVRLNRSILEQILLNLITNAVEALPQGQGLVRIQTKSQGEKALLVVEDTGRGIREELLEEIFEPFFTTKESGSGLGLSLIKGWVEEFGGEIRVESEEGKGSRFVISLPTVQLEVKNSSTA